LTHKKRSALLAVFAAAAAFYFADPGVYQCENPETGRSAAAYKLFYSVVLLKERNERTFIQGRLFGDRSIEKAIAQTHCQI
jgi:hypothetical protein